MNVTDLLSKISDTKKLLRENPQNEGAKKQLLQAKTDLDTAIAEGSRNEAIREFEDWIKTNPGDTHVASKLEQLRQTI